MAELTITSLGEAYRGFRAQMIEAGTDVPPEFAHLAAEGSAFVPMADRMAFALARAAFVRDQYDAELSIRGTADYTVDRILTEAAAARPRRNAIPGSAASDALLRHISSELVFPELWRMTAMVPGRPGNIKLRYVETAVRDAGREADADGADMQNILGLLVANRYRAKARLLLRDAFRASEELRQAPPLRPISPSNWERVLRSSRPPTVAVAYECERAISREIPAVATQLYGNDNGALVNAIAGSISLLKSGLPSGEVTRIRVDVLTPLLAGDVEAAYETLREEVTAHPTWFGPLAQDRFGVLASRDESAPARVALKPRQIEEQVRRWHRHVWLDRASGVLVQVSQPILGGRGEGFRVVQRPLNLDAQSGQLKRGEVPWGTPEHPRLVLTAALLDVVAPWELVYETPAGTRPIHGSPYSSDDTHPWAALAPDEQDAILSRLAESGIAPRNTAGDVDVNTEWLRYQERVIVGDTPFNRPLPSPAPAPDAQVARNEAPPLDRSARPAGRTEPADPDDLRGHIIERTPNGAPPVLYCFARLDGMTRMLECFGIGEAAKKPRLGADRVPVAVWRPAKEPVTQYVLLAVDTRNVRDIGTLPANLLASLETGHRMLRVGTAFNDQVHASQVPQSVVDRVAENHPRMMRLQAAEEWFPLQNVGELKPPDERGPDDQRDLPGGPTVPPRLDDDPAAGGAAAGPADPPAQRRGRGRQGQTGARVSRGHPGQRGGGGRRVSSVAGRAERDHGDADVAARTAPISHTPVADASPGEEHRAEGPANGRGGAHRPAQRAVEVDRTPRRVQPREVREQAPPRVPVASRDLAPSPPQR